MNAASIDATALLELARGAIDHGLRHGRPPAVPAATGALALPGACFVSLHIGDGLRGCIGQTERSRPLAAQIADHAYAAAFRDPRFPPLTRAELERLTIEIHLLGPLEALVFPDLPTLHELLRPGEDGLQLEISERRGVFLPVMWKELPTPERFVAHLLRKAGIRETAGLTASRFSAEVYSE